MTSRVSFNDKTSTFRLHAANSLYVFSISSSLGLQHIYWGPFCAKIQQIDYSIKSSSSMKQYFEAPERGYSFYDRVQDFLNEELSTNELLEEWRQNRSLIHHKMPYFEIVQRKRIENISWRRMSMIPYMKKSLFKSIDPYVFKPSRETINTTIKSQKLSIRRDELLLEYSDHGSGDFCNPSFKVECDNGNTVTPVRYLKHEIIRGKVSMPDYFPGVTFSEEEATTLIVTMHDVCCGLEIDLIYVCMHNFNAITRRVVFKNRGVGGMVLSVANSVTLDLSAHSRGYYLTQLSGSWARERHEVTHKLEHGIHQIGSTRGVSSHEHNPFAAISRGPPNERNGEVYGFSFIYSGNFLIESEINDIGNLRVNIGIHPNGFSWRLESGSDFHTPEVLLSRSKFGLGGVSRTLSRLYNDHLLPRTWADDNPPILINTWETMYYDVNYDALVDLAYKAVSVGINLLVLDDGWFGNRHDDTSSLGDWVLNKSKFPGGLRNLVSKINSMGLKFGIWIEPEMISEDSNLFREHPDWCLHVPGRVKQVGRNQLVLDIGNPLIRDYVCDEIAALLKSANIEYIKWDMNRPLTAVYTQREGQSNIMSQNSRPFSYACSGYQDETSHRYMLGVYEMLYRIRRDFPNVLLETSASGGGRFDAGMLYFGPQIWGSDNTSGISRMKIKFGTFLAYPVRCLGAHVSSAPNHITGETSSLRTRAFLAMNGAFGFELDIRKFSPSDMSDIKKYVQLYQSIAPVIRWGDMYRLWSPFRLSLCAWMIVSRDKNVAVLFAFSNNYEHWNRVVPRLCLEGLQSDAEYEVSEPLPNNLSQKSFNLRISETSKPVYQMHGNESVKLSGDILMCAGLPLKFYSVDDSLLFLIKKVHSVKPMNFFAGTVV